jgi:hypothetical protein
MTRSFRPRHTAGDYDHRRWLSLIDVSGPFLSVPVLRQTWPNLDALDKPERERLRTRHAEWLEDQAAGQPEWLAYVLGDLLEWGDTLHRTGLDRLAVEVAEHDTVLNADFALVQPGEEIKPDTVRVIGLTCAAGNRPTARIPGSTWAATPADRVAQMCRHHEIELGLATDGRFWTLVWAPRGGATMMATFDAIAWADAAERDVVRAFRSLLRRSRFFGVTEDEKLVPLLRKSLDNQEEITEALGVQVRQAVELLVGAFGRIDVRDRQQGGRGLQDETAHEVYRGAVSVMMRIVFLLFAEERKLLPADNELYATAYSAGRLREDLEQQVSQGSEEDLEHSTAAWQRLLALFTAVYRGVDHPRLTMHAHDGSLFDPAGMPWLPHTVDDRTVLHMLRAVQRVKVGTGKNKEDRSVSFRSLDVEQIGYVYEGLLSYEGFRADDVTVGLVGTKEGMEAEVRLTELEDLADRFVDVPVLAKALAEKYKDSKIGSVATLTKHLAPLEGTDREEARKKLLAVTDGDYPLSERLLPFFRVIRLDLRGLPVIVLPGALFVTESALRRNTGTHYTPRFLAEEVVRKALEPLVYKPGPFDSPDRSQWRRKSSAEILSLKVADIAVGSAAFLVAAARYLADQLIEAWIAEGQAMATERWSPSEGEARDTGADGLVVGARRRIIENCLYGVDVNPMAVEMAKLSLWLVSMDSVRPFTFLDDRLVVGDSLLGITSLEQVEMMHMDVRRGRDIRDGVLFDWADGIRSVVADIARDRRGIVEVQAYGNGVGAIAEKRRRLRDVEARTEKLRIVSDLLVGATLREAEHGDRSVEGACAEAGLIAGKFLEGSDAEAALEKREQWLSSDAVEGAGPRLPLHWPLTFPEVFERGGFDAVIGNPPFLDGGSIRRALGGCYRYYIGRVVAGGRRAKRPDLLAFFLLRAYSLLRPDAVMACIGTNTVGQGDTREIGLDVICGEKGQIYAAVKSQPWPTGGASVHYSVVCVTNSHELAPGNRELDGVLVDGITASLDAASRITGNPIRLTANKSIVFQGSVLYGIGFTVPSDIALGMIDRDPDNAAVVRPFLGGEDVNQDPDQKASRHVVSFGEMGFREASRHTEPFEWVRANVLPERLRLDPRRYGRIIDNWWQYWAPRTKLYHAIRDLDRVIVISRVTKHGMSALVPARQEFGEGVVVFASGDTGLFALLSSALHYWWTIRRSSSLESRIRYAMTDVFETMALPPITRELSELGDRLDVHRRTRIGQPRNIGITDIYNSFHNPSENDHEISMLRNIHRAVDYEVCRSYGWHDLADAGLKHDFYPFESEMRYTVDPVIRQELTDRLLELNVKNSLEAGKGVRAGRASTPGEVPGEALFDVP